MSRFPYAAFKTAPPAGAVLLFLADAVHSFAHFGHTSPKGGPRAAEKGGNGMETFYKVCVILLIIGGVNWGLVGLFSFDAVGWLLGGSASLLSRIVFTVVGVAAVCAIPGLCGVGGNGQTGAE